LTDLGGDDRFPLGQFINGLDHVLGFDHSLLFIIHTVDGLEFIDLMMPFIQPCLEGVDLFLFEEGKNFGEDAFTVPDDRKIDSHIFADGGRIDVDMNDFCLGGEGLDLAGDPVIKSRSDGDEEVRLHDRHVGPIGPVHSQHAQRQGMIAREAAQPHQGHGHRNTQLFRKKGELLRCV
jgi:hypothetical protein